jgi:hypothetical protein
MSALPRISDPTRTSRDFRYVPKAEVVLVGIQCI